MSWKRYFKEPFLFLIFFLARSKLCNKAAFLFFLVNDSVATFSGPFLITRELYIIKTRHGLSNKSETGKDPKKFREERRDCNQINQTSNILNNIFTKSLNSPDNSAAILFNCLKNLEGKIMEISGSFKETKATQIKGEKQLSDLTT